MSWPSIPEKPRALPLISINAPAGATTVNLALDLAMDFVFAPTDREAVRELTSVVEAEDVRGSRGGVDEESEEVVRVGGRDVVDRDAGAGADTRARDLARCPLLCFLLAEGISRPLGFCAWTKLSSGAGARIGASAMTERATIKVIICLTAFSFPLFSIKFSPGIACTAKARLWEDFLRRDDAAICRRRALSWSIKCAPSNYFSSSK